MPKSKISSAYGRNAVAMRAIIDSERTAFSNVGPDAEPLDALVAFIIEHSELYGSLDPSGQILVDGRLEADVNLRVRGRFKAADMAAHLTSLLAEEAKDLAKMSKEVWLELLADAENEGETDGAVRIGVKIYGASGSYDAADSRFSKFIDPSLAKLNAATLTELLDLIEGNQETYGRGRAGYEHPKIETVAGLLGVNTTGYTSYTKSL